LQDSFTLLSKEDFDSSVYAASFPIFKQTSVRMGMIIYSIHTLLITIIPPAASALIIGLTLILSAMIVMSVAGQKPKD